MSVPPPEHYDNGPDPVRTNTPQASEPKVNTGPEAFFESRTPTPVTRTATSTQSLLLLPPL